MEEVLKALSTIGLSSIKHMMGGVAAASYDYTYLEAFTYTAIGGILGVAFFIFLSKTAQNFFSYIFPKKKKKKKRKFTKFSRFIVRVKQRFGLAGIAFITPWFLTVPVGTMISCGLYRDKRKVFIYQSASILIWSLIGGGLAQPIAALLH